MEYLAIHHVSQECYFDKKKLDTVLEEINLTGRKGEIIGIVVKSANERTAFMHILGGMCAPKTGSFFLDSLPVPFDSDRELANFRNENIGYVSKDYPLLEKWNVMENIALPLVFSQKTAKSQMRKICGKALANVDLASYLDREVWPLTWGEKIRVMMARALVNHPKLLVGEDLLEGLNHFQARKIMDAIVKLPDQGITTVLLMQEVDLLKCCTRDLLLKDGKIVEY